MASKAKRWPWSVLDLPGPAAETRDIRRAYAVRLKALSPEDVTGFEALRSAYDAALAHGQKKKARPAKAVAAMAPPLSPVPTASAAATGLPPTAADTAQTPVPPVAAATSHDPDETTALPATWNSDTATQAAQAEYLRQLEAMLDRQNFSLSRWEPFFDSALLQDPAFFRQVEQTIIGRVGHTRPDFPAPWSRRADEVFGWSTDGVGFARRFPLAGGFLAQVTGNKPIAVTPPPAKRAVSATLLWIIAIPAGTTLLKLGQTSGLDEVNWVILAIFGLVMAFPTVAILCLGAYALVSACLMALGHFRPEFADKRYAIRRAIWNSKTYSLPWKLALMGAVGVVWAIYMMVMLGKS